MLNITKVAPKMKEDDDAAGATYVTKMYSQRMLNIAKVAAKKKEDDDTALVETISFRNDFSYLLSHVLKLPWTIHMHEFNRGFQPSRQTLMKESVQLPWASFMHLFKAFQIVKVNPYPAVGPNQGGHFRALMEKKDPTKRFDRLLERNAVKRILQPSCLARLDDSEASHCAAWQSQMNPYWRNTWKNRLDRISPTVLEGHIQCLAAFEKDPEGVWVRTERTPEAMASDVRTVLRWVLNAKLAEHNNVEKLEKMDEKIEADLKAQNPDTFRTRQDTRNMVDAMKVCIHRGNDEKRWAHEAKEAAAAAEAARVAKKAAKAAKKRK